MGRRLSVTRVPRSRAGRKPRSATRRSPHSLGEGERMQRFLKRSVICLLPCALAALALTVPASAGPDGNTSATGVTSPALLALIGNNDLFSTIDLSTVLDPTGTTPTQHYGPYSRRSPDSGTCGND